MSDSTLLVDREWRVNCSPEHAFAVFTDRLDAWWPVSHRRGADSQLRFETGGPDNQRRLVERRADGGEIIELGRVLLWDPGRTLVYRWFPGMPPGAATIVTVEFLNASGGHCVVRIRHRAAAPEEAQPTDEAVGRFLRGWETVLPAFAAACEN
ncbi:MAG: SRPBCC domain-containing protein [bacterium]|nr:SRPBCC domain-containing protein [bacterium]